MPKTIDKNKKPFVYECGHKTNGVILMNSDALSLSTYIQWAIEEDNLNTQKECFDCFLKKLSGEKMKCELCKKDVFKGYYERNGGIDYYYHESCKNTSIKQFLDEEVL